MSEEKKIELVYEAISQAKQMIEQICKPEGKTFIRYDDFTDGKVREYYYQLNDMCIELADRKVFPWQRGEKDGN